MTEAAGEEGECERGDYDGGTERRGGEGLKGGRVMLGVGNSQNCRWHQKSSRAKSRAADSSSCNHDAFSMI
jgi:hypothetical protein